MTIKEALGRLVACPIVSGKARCGTPTEVRHAQARVVEKIRVPDPHRPGQYVEIPAPKSEPIRTAANWYRLDCPRCGSKLYKADTPVEVIG